MSPGPRMSSSILNVELNGTRMALLAGGWDHRALKDSAYFGSVATSVFILRLSHYGKIAKHNNSDFDYSII